MDPRNDNEMIVVDVKMKFWSMVVFMVKWVIASIPAFIILAIIWAIMMSILQGLSGGPGWWHGRMH